jgi:site-specific DNA-methyltransferase (adenine-specific)
MDDSSIDAIVTDPPYGLSKEPDIVALLRYWLDGGNYQHKSNGFMGKKWDSLTPHPDIWRECYRIIKPGGYVLSFASTRTFDLMAIALRLAGFEQHPFFAYIFGSGFPKATNLSKQLDRMAGMEREVVGKRTTGIGTGKGSVPIRGDSANMNITAPATPEAKQWDGYFYGKQSLKPAMEPVLMFQKPAERGLNMAQNVLKWGVGAVNIDGCRVEIDKDSTGERRYDLEKRFQDPDYTIKKTFTTWHMLPPRKPVQSLTKRFATGRWPANVAHDGSAEVLAGFPETGFSKGGGGKKSPCFTETNQDTYKKDYGAYTGFLDSGSAARFFYCAKACKGDRDKELDEFEFRACGMMEDDAYPITTGSGNIRDTKRRNHHPTVKPTALMRYLCRLITPPQGLILDPYMGSGSTGKAALLEGFRFTGIELDAEYIEIARARIEHAYKQRAKDIVKDKQQELFN